MVDKIQYPVLVECMTYNQSNYIIDALNGFVMQKTTFPFVCLVMDDASTDGEREIIMNFLEKECEMSTAQYFDIEEANVVIVSHKDNPNCNLSVYFLKKNLNNTPQKRRLINQWAQKSKYIALCEGDDYWIDKDKLQKQFDLLESRPDVSLCFHCVKWERLDGSIEEKEYPLNIPVESGETELVNGNYVPTLSVMFRYYPSVFEQKNDLGKMFFGDYPLWLLLSQKGLVYQLPDVMAVYRVGPGIWSSLNVFEQCLISAVGYGKMFTYVRDEINRNHFDNLIDWNISQVKSQYYKILFSKEYKLGNLILKPLRKLKKLFSQFHV